MAKSTNGWHEAKDLVLKRIELLHEDVKSVKSDMKTVKEDIVPKLKEALAVQSVKIEERTGRKAMLITLIGSALTTAISYVLVLLKH